jgi:hypothetical protein
MIKSFKKQHDIQKGNNKAVICLIMCVLAVYPFGEAFSYAVQRQC